MYTCANCSVLACASEDRTKMPANCPMRDQEVLVEILKAYQEPENHEFYVKCSALEAEGYCQWPRLKETVELCRRMGYHKIGLAFFAQALAEGQADFMVAHPLAQLHRLL